MQGIRQILTGTLVVAYLVGVSGDCISLSKYTPVHSSEHQLHAPEGRAVHSVNSIRGFQKTKQSTLFFFCGFCSSAVPPGLWSISQFRLDEANPESIIHRVVICGRAPPPARRSV